MCQFADRAIIEKAIAYVVLHGRSLRCHLGAGWWCGGGALGGCASAVDVAGEDADQCQGHGDGQRDRRGDERGRDMLAQGRRDDGRGLTVPAMCSLPAEQTGVLLRTIEGLRGKCCIRMAQSESWVRGGDLECRRERCMQSCTRCRTLLI